MTVKISPISLNDESQVEKAQKMLTSFGLSVYESKIYVYLLERGGITGGSKIAIGTKLHRQYVYLALPKLLELGLVEEIAQGKLSKYKARSPKEIEKLAKKKVMEAEDIVKELEKFSKVGHEQDFEVVVGEVAYRKYEIERARSMKDGDIQYLIGSSSDEYLEIMGDSYEDKYVPLLEEKKIKTYYLAPKNQKERKTKISSRQHFESRVLPNLKPGYVTTMIQGDNLVFYSNVLPMSIYVIKSEKVAESYKDFFMMLWEMAGEG